MRRQPATNGIHPRRAHAQEQEAKSPTRLDSSHCPGHTDGKPQEDSDRHIEDKQGYPVSEKLVMTGKNPHFFRDSHLIFLFIFFCACFEEEYTVWSISVSPCIFILKLHVLEKKWFDHIWIQTGSNHFFPRNYVCILETHEETLLNSCSEYHKNLKTSFADFFLDEPFLETARPPSN